MKKTIVIFFIFCANCFATFAQKSLIVFFVDATTDSIPIYCCDKDTTSFYIIKENEQEENWHNVELLEQSNNRYKVRITSCKEDATTPIIGWVDKEQCGVWLWGKKMSSKLWTFRLYRKPEQLHPFVRIVDEDIDGFGKYTNDKAAPVLDYKYYKGKYWIKTEILKDKKKYVGWTIDYCPNIYGSCN